MSNHRLRFQCAILAAGLFLSGGCRKAAEANPPATPQATSPTSPARHHSLSLGGVSPLIVSMSPDTIRVHNGHASVARYSLAYEIDHPEKVTKAMISIYAPGVGELQKFDVDVQASAQIEFLLDATAADLGPTVRFRAHCPSGDSDWYTLGSCHRKFRNAYRAFRLEV
jgi:hypothetical protein